ncbi:MAG: chemotaxis protein CheW [Alphaproteobacteria bacterium]|nr:chemotaxis protein CheW [Alphaproteobacteria bacterium]
MSAAIGGAMTALTLRLQDEVFAIEAERVREILDMVPITGVPGAPPFVNGLINVRGRVVPLADLRVMFGMDRPEPDADTRIVVIELESEGDSTIAGIIADKVESVTDIEATSIQDAPRVGMRWRKDFVRGIGKRNGDFIIIPNLEKIFELQDAKSVSAEDERASL